MRWKLVGWVSVVATLGGYGASSASSAPQATALAAQELVRGMLAAGQTYTISGDRYEFQGHSYFGLGVRIDGFHPPAGDNGMCPGVSWCASFTPSKSPPDGTFRPLLPGSRTTSPGVLAFIFIGANVCPQRSAVIFGLLRAPSDVVLARQGGRTTMLQHVTIPAVLQPGGVLVDARLASEPNEVIVRRHDGTRLLDDKFRVSGRCVTPG